MFLNKSAKSGTSFTKKVSDLEPCIKYVPKLEFFTLKNVNFDTFHNFPKTLPQAFFYAIVLDVRTEKQESEERNIDSKNYTQAANERTGWAAGSPRNRRPLPERKKPYCMGVFRQAFFPIFVIPHPHCHHGKFLTFSRPCQDTDSTTASCRIRACSIR